MPVDAKEFYKLETIVEITREELTRTIAEVKELHGLIKEVRGMVSVSLQQDAINKRLDEIVHKIEIVDAVNLSQEKTLGGVIEALKHSKDRDVAKAANSIVVNVRQGSDINNTGPVGQQNIGQTGGSASSE